MYCEFMSRVQPERSSVLNSLRLVDADARYGEDLIGVYKLYNGSSDGVKCEDE